LVESPGGGGVVRRDDGGIVVTPDLSDDQGQLLRASYRPVNVWLGEDRSLVGGLLPAGAVSVEVVDQRGERVGARVGGGAYAAVLEQPADGGEPVVCCRDAAGAVVRRPLPDDYPGSPLTDAEEPCPACGAVDYEERFPTEYWRARQGAGDGPMITSPIVVCRVCGHEETVSLIQRSITPDDEDDGARAQRIARRAKWRAEWWHDNQRVLRSVGFSVYAVEGWPAHVSGSGSDGERPTEVTIAHTETEDADLVYAQPRIEVTTSTDEPYLNELAHARQRLEWWVKDEIDPPGRLDLSDAAITLWFRAAARRRSAAALAAVRTDAEIVIDGAAQPFVVLTSSSGRWVAVRRHNDLTVTIAAHDLDPTKISLAPVADTASLRGPNPRISNSRAARRRRNHPRETLAAVIAPSSRCRWCGDQTSCFSCEKSSAVGRPGRVQKTLWATFASRDAAPVAPVGQRPSRPRSLPLLLPERGQRADVCRGSEVAG
jgi:hypothetical protein